MKAYKTTEDLIEYLSSKGVTISDKSEALQKMERYTYYSIVNTYKSIMLHLMKYMLYLNLIRD